MRSVLVGLLTCSLAGCATVSMSPGDATVEMAITDEQTALRKTSDAYCQAVTDEGWVNERSSLASLASILISGRRSDETTPQTYGDEIGVETGHPEELSRRIAKDADTAREGLGRVVAEAEAVRHAGSEIARGDVTSFERALVRAQRAHRAFAAATETVMARGAEARAAVHSVEAFAAQIDTARGIADDLLERYTGTGHSAS